MSKVALVTGSTSGIGKAIALNLAQQGITVYAHYLSHHDRAQTTLHELQKINPSCKLLQFDISSSDQVFSATQGLEVDILVNNAGIHFDQHSVLMTDENFEKVVQTNLFGAFYISKVLAKKMLAKKSGCIVNISSLAGQVGNIGQANYAASKAGLIALTKTMAMELGPRGIRVNAVAPGFIETEMIQNVPHLEEYKKMIPLRRFGTTEEVAQVVSFLCSDAASYINGHTISVNGGLYSN